MAGRLHERSARQSRAANAPLLIKAARSRIRQGTWDPTKDPGAKTWLSDKLVALDPQTVP